MLKYPTQLRKVLKSIQDLTTNKMVCPSVQKRKKKDTPAASSGNREIKAMFANHERRKKTQQKL